MLLVSETTTPRIPGEQKFWLVVHWFALLQTLSLFVTAVAGGSTVAQSAIVAVSCVATALAVYFPMRIARRRVSTVFFVKWTAVARLIAVGWTLIGIVLFLVPVVSVLANVDLGDNEDWTAGYLGPLGVVAFLTMVGPGYAQFREAMVQKDVTAVP